MTEPPSPLDAPSPDEAHEAMRVAVRQALADLAAQVEQGEALQQVADTAQAAIAESAADRVELWAALTDLTARVTALELQPPTV